MDRQIERQAHTIRQINKHLQREREIERAHTIRQIDRLTSNKTNKHEIRPNLRQTCQTFLLSAEWGEKKNEIGILLS